MLMRICDTLARSLWATSLLGSFAYNFSQPGLKTSVKLMLARRVTHGMELNFKLTEWPLSLHSLNIADATLASGGAQQIEFRPEVVHAPKSVKCLR